MRPLLSLSSFSRFKEQLALELHKSQRESLQELIAVIADTINTCVHKKLSVKRLDDLFWLALTPAEMHKHPPQPYEESLATAIPFINAEINNLCTKLSIPLIQSFEEDYTPIIDAVEAGIKLSQKGYLAPVESIRKQLAAKDSKIIKYKQKIKEQKEYIDNLEQQIQEYEQKQKLLEQSLNRAITEPLASSRSRPSIHPPSNQQTSNHILSNHVPSNQVLSNHALSNPSERMRQPSLVISLREETKKPIVQTNSERESDNPSEKSEASQKEDIIMMQSSASEQEHDQKTAKKPRKPRAPKGQGQKRFTKREDTKSFLLGQASTDV